MVKVFKAHNSNQNVHHLHMWVYSSISESTPLRRWLHKIKKADTPGCDCQDEEEGEEEQDQSGEHLVERCRLLAAARELVVVEETREWETHHARDKKKKKGDVGIEKEKEKEEGGEIREFL